MWLLLWAETSDQSMWMLGLSATLSTINTVTRSTNYIGRDTYGDISIDAVYDEIKIYKEGMLAADILNDYIDSSSGNFLLISKHEKYIMFE